MRGTTQSAQRSKNGKQTTNFGDRIGDLVMDRIGNGPKEDFEKVRFSEVKKFFE